MKNKNPKIFIICGKARSGKDTISNIIKEYKPNSVILSITNPLKEYAKKITDWNGDEITKPRDLLQNLGINIIKKEIDSNLLTRRIIEDIKIMSYYKDYIIVSGIRLKDEVNILKNSFNNVFSIKIERPNFDNGLTDKQKQHITENDLNDFKTDYLIINDQDLNYLKKEIKKILDEV